MLRSFRDFQGHVVRAIDGELGKADDFLFEDLHWKIRYFIVDTGNWLGRRILISPQSVSDSHWQSGIIPLKLTLEQIRTSPDINVEKSISLQEEERFANHFELPFYWLYLPGFGPYSPLAGVPNPPMLSEEVTQEPEAKPSLLEKAQVSPHLHSAHQMLGCKIFATDGKIGHLYDFGFDPESWAIRCLIVEFGPVLVRKRVMIPTESIKENDWKDFLVRLRLSREEVENSPELEPAVILNPGKAS